MTIPKRAEGFYWVVHLDAYRIPRWTPAEFFNGKWTFPGIQQAIPERKLIVGDYIPYREFPDPKYVRRVRARRARVHRKRRGLSARS